MKKGHDYVLIDCMPSLGMLTINALAAADSVIVPVQAQYLPAKGMTELMKTIGKVQRQINPSLKVDGVLLTLADMRTNLARITAESIRQAKTSQYITENILDRQFRAQAPNEKWLTDVTEFHYYVGLEKRKVYLSAILDLYDRRIVSYAIGDANNNAFVFCTFDEAIKENPDAHPLFHSDRGFQYTNRTFHEKLKRAGMIQSMSRVAKCIDNGLMEGVWGILKRERYYGRRFTSREMLVTMIEGYIAYYNDRRLQRNLGVMTPTEKHESYLRAA